VKQIAGGDALIGVSTEAIMTSITPEADTQVCQIQGCERTAVYQLVKMHDHASEQERFFCYDHGIEYANRAHLVISENV
jgi:hypothetical protein